jgi:hypothetical protein
VGTGLTVGDPTRRLVLEEACPPLAPEEVRVRRRVVSRREVIDDVSPPRLTFFVGRTRVQTGSAMDSDGEQDVSVERLVSVFRSEWTTRTHVAHKRVAEFG